ncbi:MAG: hypothetical protein D6790_06725 [Caldilineae bacterium]|nr:MAG: hypothetical protein D6790_06725 [Caldilineae bacterium]
MVAPATYTETLSLSKDLTLLGAGPETTIIDAGGANRVLSVIQARVVISGFTLQNGRTNLLAGGLFNSGTLTLDHVVVRFNQGLEPGGLFNSTNGVLLLRNSLVYSNTAQQRAGGIWNAGQMTVLSSTVRGNQALGVGGGVLASRGAVTVEASLIEGNTSDLYGGGLFVGDSRLLVSRSVLSGNLAVEGGGIVIDMSRQPARFEAASIVHNRAITGSGGLQVRTSVGVTLVNSTVSSNRALTGGGLGVQAATLVLSNVTVTANQGQGGGGLRVEENGSVGLHSTVVAGNLDPEAVAPDCAGQIVSLGYNLFGNASGCGLTPGPGDLLGQDAPLDPLLGPLTLVAGLPVHPPQLGSPLVDAGDPTDCPPWDQVGGSRPQDGDRDGSAICDVGAVERPPMWRVFLPLVRGEEVKG